MHAMHAIDNRLLNGEWGLQGDRRGLGWVYKYEPRRLSLSFLSNKNYIQTICLSQNYGRVVWGWLVDHVQLLKRRTYDE